MGRLTLVGAGGPPWDPDAQAYFNQLVPQPSTSYKTAVNVLVRALKASGDWNRLDRLWIHATEAQQNARISLVNPTSTALTEVNSPTWTANQGYNGDAATSYLQTSYRPSVNAVHFAVNAASIFMYSRTNSDVNAIEIGVQDESGANSNGSFMNVRRNTNQTNFNINSGTASTLQAGPTNSLGLFIAERTAAGTQTIYKNAVQVATNTRASDALETRQFYLLARNSNGVPDGFSARQISFSGMGTVLDKAAFYAALQAFATTRGFNV